MSERLETRPAERTPTAAGHTETRADEGLLLLYDGLCGFCNGTVRFVLARDRLGSMRFAPLQGETARAVIDRHPAVRGIDSIVLVETDDQGREHVSVRTDAVLRIAKYLGGGWRVAVLFGLVPRPVRDWGYSLFARFRYQLFGRYDTCPLPNPEVRRRFLP